MLALASIKAHLCVNRQVWTGEKKIYSKAWLRSLSVP